jgi:cysteine desulfurase
MLPMPSYFDFAATTQMDSRVAEIVRHYMCEEFGNSGSRTHVFGINARNAVEKSRQQVADVVGCETADVIFTSGATEANNLAILGLRQFGESQGKRHLITTGLEHKAVLEPIEHLEKHGFSVTVVPPQPDGLVSPADISKALTKDTLMVSVMHVNNETGIIQPLAQIAEAMGGHTAFLHVDAAQGFGKELELLPHPRIDLISISGHKIYAPKGVGALIAKRRLSSERPPLSPLMYGGGQERGLRPGTLPVALIAGLGEAARLALAENEVRAVHARKVEQSVLNLIERSNGVVNGARGSAIPHIVNASFRGLDSEAFIVATKDLIAISNGAACSSHSYELSHVLKSMGLEEWRLRGAIRFSFSHESAPLDVESLARQIERVRF